MPFRHLPMTHVNEVDVGGGTLCRSTDVDCPSKLVQGTPQRILHKGDMLGLKRAAVIAPLK